MDIYCPKCGEPWENDTLHDRAEETDSTYRAVARDFQTRGCAALDSTCSPVPIGGTDSRYGLTRAQAATALYDVLGDDLDGAASELYDLFA